MNRNASTLIVATFCLFASIPVAAQSTGDERELDLKNMAKDVEVMRRVIAKSVETATTPSAKASRNADVSADGKLIMEEMAGDYRMYDAWRHLSPESTKHSQGFHVPGVGVVFSFELSVPVREVAEKESEKGDKGKSDVWDETRAEVRGRQRTTAYGLRTTTEKRWSIDSYAVDRVVDKVIQALADHGTKIRQLSSRESIIVGVRFVPGGAPLATTNDATSLFTLVQGRAAQARHAVVQVPVGSLEDHKSGKIDGDMLRDRITVTQYDQTQATVDWPGGAR